MENQLLCTYQLILFIIKNYTINNENLNILDLQNDLTELYFNNKYSEELLSLRHKYTPFRNVKKEEDEKKFKETHKKNLKELIDTLKKTYYKDEIEYKKLSDIKILIKNIIQNNDYSLTYIDIYLLCKKYQIPLIIICNTSIHFPIINSNFIVVNPELSLEPNFKGFYFIKVPTSYTRGIKNYKLLHFESSILFNIDLDINKSGTAVCANAAPA